MGDLLQFPTHRTNRGRVTTPVARAFYFDVGDPMSYLTAERVERTFGDVEWVVVDDSALDSPRAGDESRSRESLRAPERRRRTEAHARALRLPLVWPDFGDRAPDAPHARRAAAFACELGAGPAFALALSRLAFCGGFALDDPETLAEAAAASGIPLRACLEAAGEAWRDEELRETARALRAEGVTSLPAVRLSDGWLQGESELVAAAVPVAAAARPLAPVG